MEYLLQNYAHKLAGVERLDIFPSDDDSATEYPSWDPLEVKEFDKDQVIPSKIYSASLPLRLLPGLRPFLHQVTDLQFGIPADALH